MLTFRDIYLKILRKALNRQSAEGAMPAGHNGHYHDVETPVRNTSHYLIAFLRAWELSGEERFKTASERCFNWLIKDNPHRQAHTFQHRTKVGKDHCNGLIGPAWNMEALLYAADRLQREDARRLARELFLMHPFDYAVGVWKRVEPDGTTLSLDPTFNHQLWFAACASPLATDTPEVKERIFNFLSKAKKNWKLARNGRIIHPLWLPKRKLRESLKRLIKPTYRREVIAKEIGYQSFNLQAFSMLNHSTITLPKLIQNRVNKALNYLDHPQFLDGIRNAICGFPYNPPGWEVSVSKTILGNAPPEACQTWIERQLQHSYDADSKMLSCNTADPETHTARIYEAMRLTDRVFELKIDFQV